MTSQWKYHPVPGSGFSKPELMRTRGPLTVSVTRTAWSAPLSPFRGMVYLSDQLRDALKAGSDLNISPTSLHTVSSLVIRGDNNKGLSFQSIVLSQKMCYRQYVLDALSGPWLCWEQEQVMRILGEYWQSWTASGLAFGRTPTMPDVEQRLALFMDLLLRVSRAG